MRRVLVVVLAMLAVGCATLSPAQIAAERRHITGPVIGCPEAFVQVTTEEGPWTATCTQNNRVFDCHGEIVGGIEFVTVCDPRP